MDATNPTNKVAVKFAKGSSDFDQAEMPLEPNFEDKSGKKRITGAVQFAIDGNDDTAWGIDAGPGRRNQERKAVFQCATNIGFSGGTILLIQLAQNHGGWENDDILNKKFRPVRPSAPPNPRGNVAHPLAPKKPGTFFTPRHRR